MRTLAYYLIPDRTLVESPEGTALRIPQLAAGQSLKLGVRFLDRIAGQIVEVNPAVRAARAFVGNRDARPGSGTWKLQLGTGSSTGANTTTALDFATSASALAAALNELSGGPGDITVDEITGGYVIARPGGAELTLTARANNLKPVSFARVRGYQVDGLWKYELRLTQSPLAFEDAFERVLPSAPSISTVRDGGADPSGTYLWSEIQKLTVPPDFRGSYHIRRPAIYARTPLLSLDDGAEEIAAALASILQEGETVAVTNPEPNAALITFGGEALGVDLEEMVVSVFSAPPGDVTLDIELGRPEMWAALRDVETLENLPFELEFEFVPTEADVEDLEIPSTLSKSSGLALEIIRPIGWEGLAAAAGVDWIEPPSPRDYVPFTPDQIITGSQHWTGVIGNGSATSFVIAHNLDSSSLHVTIRNNGGTNALVETGAYDIVFNSANSLTVTFSVAPTASQYAVVITAAGPISAFQTHTHTIPQVVDLEDILDDLGSRVTELEEILPSTGPAATATSSEGLVTVIPETREVLFYRGTDEEADALWTETGVDVKLLPSERQTPFMLPAQHSSEPTEKSSEELISDPDVVNELTDGGPVLIGGEGRIRATTANDGDLIGWDARTLYPVTRSGTTKSYYPTVFERTLWAMAINDKMLAVNRTFELTFGLQLQLLRANCKAQWVLSIQLGAFAADTTPATTGLNLDSVTWAAPVFEQPIVLSRLAQSHFFGIRIKREASAFKLDQQLYGVWGGNNASAPASANFAIRARLDRFDTEDIADPRGWVTYRLIGAIDTTDDGTMTTKPAVARIV